MKQQESAVALRPEPSIAMLLAGVIEKGVTADNVEALTALCGLKERMDAKEAEREFNAAFAQLQSEMPRVVATKPVPNRDGTIRYHFAPYEEILEQVQPFLTKHGFSVSFTTKFSEGRITSVCTLRHISGHSQTNEFMVRIGQGPPGSTESQADCSAKNYAKRGAFSDAVNIVVDKDDDARMVGKPIGMALAEDLKARVKACGADEAAFLKYAGATDYDSIPDDRFDALDALLKRKESGKKEPRDSKGYLF